MCRIACFGALGISGKMLTALSWVFTALAKAHIQAQPDTVHSVAETASEEEEASLEGYQSAESDSWDAKRSSRRSRH